MTHKLEDLIDINQLQVLQDRLNEIYSFPSAIIDNDGKILTATCWQDVCTKFHRINPESQKECIKSDQYILEHLSEAKPTVTYKCPHGLVDNATPIIIQGNHYGNFFTGQFFLEPPDLDFFRNQALRFGFDENEYIEAVKKVPIWNQKQLESYIFFIKGLIEVISFAGLRKLHEIESQKELAESEAKFKNFFENSPNGKIITGLDGSLVEVNNAICGMLGYSREELKKLRFEDITHPDDLQISNLYFAISEEKESDPFRFEKRYIKKNGEFIWVEIISALQKDLTGKPLYFLTNVIDITQRKQAEGALKKKNYEMEKIFQALPDLYFRVSLDGFVIDYKTSQLFDLYVPPEGFMNKRLQEILPAYLAELFESELSKIKAGVPLVVFKYELKVSSSEKYFEARMIPFENDQAILLIRDITERKKFEEELSLVKKSIDASSDGAYWLDKNGNFLYINDAGSKMLGYEKSELLKKHISEINVNATRERWTEVWNYVKEHKTITLESIHRRKDGSLFPVELTSNYIVFEGREFCNGFAKDITKRKEIEENLGKREAYMSAILENVPFLLWLKDVEGKFLAVNTRFALSSGNKESKELIGKTDLDIWPDELAHKYIADDNEVINNGNQKSIEEQINDRDQIKWFITYKTAIKNSDGKVIGTTGIAQDITERKKTEMELELYREHLEELVRLRTAELDNVNTLLKESLEKEQEINQLKSRFISTASHEFRTPLASALMSTDLIQKYAHRWSREKIDEHLDRIKSAISSLTKLMDGVIHINKAESGKIIFYPVISDIKDLCNKIIEEIQVYMGKDHNLDFNYKCREQFYKVDPKQLETILVNLLSNAFKYSPQGGKVSLIVEEANNALEISVIDQGIGIPEVDIPRLFEPFHRAINVEDIRGTGLGLSIVKNAVDLCKGEISIASKQDNGTNIKVKLPLAFN